MIAARSICRRADRPAERIARTLVDFLDRADLRQAEGGRILGARAASLTDWQLGLLVQVADRPGFVQYRKCFDTIAQEQGEAQ
jgi:hypothetical protein